MYALEEHVHACETNDGVILLDLRRDAYLALPTDAFKRALASDHCMDRGRPSDEALWALLQRGMVRPCLTERSNESPTRLPAPLTTLSDTTLLRPRMSSIDVLAFLWAFAVARTSLGAQPMESLVHRVRRRKVRAKLRATADAAVLHERLSVFLWLRPYVYASRGACLFDSLTLIEYLALYDIHPTWVFGIKTGPFGAHSWVQDGTCVLNDSVERVRAFTPILSV